MLCFGFSFLYFVFDILGDFLGIFGFFGQILRFFIKITCFSASPEKTCRIIWKFRQKPYFEPETYRIGPKVVIWTCPDLPRPVQEDKSLSAKQVFVFIFQKLHLSIFYWQIYHVFWKSYVLLNNFFIFCKTIGLIKGIL